MNPRRRTSGKGLALVAGLLAAAALAPAAAEARSSYCSASGDVCYEAKKTRSDVRLRISLAAKYFDTYRLCVTPPRGRSKCKSFSIRRSGEVFGSSVSWKRHFPNRGRGTYRVTWNAPDRLGPSVSFRR